jgi:DNA-binding response OmpR family regulator
MRVLVVEDEPFIRILIVETLEGEGFEILEAASGTEACALIDNPDQIDLIVTDLNLPEANGVEVAKHARRQKPTVPVLYVTARSDLLDQLAAPRPYSYLPKPFTMRELTHAVDSLIKSH